MSTRLRLGTANFGAPYGTAGAQRQVTPGELLNIVEAAAARNALRFDTAIEYPGAEAILGRALAASGIREAQVITKIMAPTVGVAFTRHSVLDLIDSALERLKLSVLEGVLLHRPSDLAGPHATALIEGMAELQSSGRCKLVGVSVYEEQDIALAREVLPLDIVQAPVSIANQTLIADGSLNRLARNGTLVHARSVFLQGVLLSTPGTEPEFFAPVRDRIAALGEDGSGAENARLRLGRCLGFVARHPAIAEIVIGMDTTAQFTETLDLLNNVASVDASLAAELAWPDSPLLRPQDWPALAGGR